MSSPSSLPEGLRRELDCGGLRQDVCLIVDAMLMLQALDVSSPSSLPEGLRRELEQIEDCGGPTFLHGLAQELQVHNLPIHLHPSTPCGCDLNTDLMIPHRTLCGSKNGSRADHLEAPNISDNQC